jgi:hypothetical protein
MDCYRCLSLRSSLDGRHFGVIARVVAFRSFGSKHRSCDDSGQLGTPDCGRIGLRHRAGCCACSHHCAATTLAWFLSALRFAFRPPSGFWQKHKSQIRRVFH